MLDPRILRAFYGSFLSLKPHQQEAIKPILGGQNLVLLAATGSGKTEAVLAPLIQRYGLDAARAGSLILLHIAPTKALVNDLERRLARPLAQLGLRIGIRHGDRDDLRLAHPPQVLITTPESLDVLLFRKDPLLQTVRAVVLDEVHLLYNTQRGLHLSILLQRLRQRAAQPIQWTALSATIGNPAHVRDFLFGTEEEAVFLENSTFRPIDARIRYMETEGKFLELILSLVEKARPKLLVFANSRRECERLAGILQQSPALSPYVFAHYSSLSTEVRLETEKRFAGSPYGICIATSTLELGIDIGSIDAVVLWGAPPSVESFLQRIGRGSRRLQKTNVIALIPSDSINPQIDALRFLSLLETAKAGELSVRQPYELFGAAAQQCLSVIGSENGAYTRVVDLLAIMRQQKTIDRPTLESILAELSYQEYLQRHGYKNRYGADEKLYELIDFRMIYGNFPAGTSTIGVHYASKILGEVPQLNLLKIKPGVMVRFAGKCWRVHGASPEGFELAPTPPNQAAVDFTYGGKGTGFTAFLTQRMWQVLHNTELPMDILDADLRLQLRSLQDWIAEHCPIDSIPFTREGGGFRYFTFAGYLVNKAVALIGNHQEFKADEFSLRTYEPVTWDQLPEDPESFSQVFETLFEVEQQTLFQTLLPQNLQLREFLQSWLRDASVATALRRLHESTPIEVPSFFASRV